MTDRERDLQRIQALNAEIAGLHEEAADIARALAEATAERDHCIWWLLGGSETVD